jgi:hypothetical protein
MEFVRPLIVREGVAGVEKHDVGITRSKAAYR